MRELVGEGKKIEGRILPEWKEGEKRSKTCKGEEKGKKMWMTMNVKENDTKFVNLVDNDINKVCLID